MRRAEKERTPSGGFSDSPRLACSHSLHEYAETVEYANESTSALIKQTFKFTAKIAGDMLTLSGVGNPWNEVWKRLNEAKPLQLNRAVPEQVIESTVTLE